MTEAETPTERRRRLLEEVPALQQSDPQRHAALVGEAAQIDATFANDARTIQHRFQQIQAWAQQQQAQAFATYAREQDAAFDKANPELQDAAKHKAAQLDAVTYLRDNGLTDEQIAWTWQTQPWFRATGTQQALFDASQFRKIKKGIAAGRSRANEEKLRAMPPVQRPGASGQVVSNDSDSLGGCAGSVPHPPHGNGPCDFCGVPAQMRKLAGR